MSKAKFICKECDYPCKVTIVAHLISEPNHCIYGMPAAPKWKPVKPKPKFKVGELVMCRDSNDHTWETRRWAKKGFCFDYIRDYNEQVEKDPADWKICDWKHIEKFDPEKVGTI